VQDHSLFDHLHFYNPDWHYKNLKIHVVNDVSELDDAQQIMNEDDEQM
jgi:hypothetical protein